MDAHAGDGSPLRLEVIAGNATGTFLVVEDDLVIGRHVEGPGRLADDEEISRSHARISREPAGLCAIEDLGSTNGTFVNGLRITSPQTLSEGDTVEVGATTLVVRETPRLASAETHAPESAAAQPTRVPRRETSDSSPQQRSAPEPAAPEPAAPEPAAPPEPAPPEPAAPEPAPPEPAPPEPAEPEPAAAEPAEPEPALSESVSEIVVPPAISLRLEIDFSAGEASVALGDDTSESIRLVFDSGVWRLARPPS